MDDPVLNPGTLRRLPKVYRQNNRPHFDHLVRLRVSFDPNTTREWPDTDNFITTHISLIKTGYTRFPLRRGGSIYNYTSFYTPFVKTTILSLLY